MREAAPKVARTVPRVREIRHKHPSVAGAARGGRAPPWRRGCSGTASPLRPPSPCNCRDSAAPLLAPKGKGEERGRSGRQRPRTSSARLAPPSPSGPSTMGPKLPSCFPRARRGRSRRAGKAGQGEPPEGKVAGRRPPSSRPGRGGGGASLHFSLPTPTPAASTDGPDAAAGRARSTPSTSSEGDPQSGRAYFSGKARVSFRHQLDSERDSTT